MDIEYLLYLQQFRETVGSILTPLMNALTKLSAGCSGGIYINSSYDVSDRVVGIVE